MYKAIILDWNRTLYDPDADQLINGAVELLESIRSLNCPMHLISKGGGDFKRHGVEQYFKDIIVVGAAKSPEDFKAIPQAEACLPHQVIVIGDRARAELEIGSSLGFATIWVRNGRFADEMPTNKELRPDYSVSNLDECKTLVYNILNTTV